MITLENLLFQFFCGLSNVKIRIKNHKKIENLNSLLNPLDTY